MKPSVLVTDTHPLLWYCDKQFRKLAARVKSAFDKAADGEVALFVPTVVLWEIAMLARVGKIELPVSFATWQRQIFSAPTVNALSIEAEDTLTANDLTFTRDPFDALIVATAIRMQCPLITKDSLIHDNKPCELFWD